MAKVQWTDEQKDAIHEIDQDILLTAGAGSGKTAVLAHRCGYLLTDAPVTCHVDELLVVTFTDAAATEMRHRIGQVLRSRLEADPGNLKLQRQHLLLDKAAISTLHSFCSALIREYFYLLDIDPSFEMLDGQQAHVLKMQAIHDVCEALYEKLGTSDESLELRRFITSYGKGADDFLADLIIDFDHFLAALDDPDKWLEQCETQFNFLESHRIHEMFVWKRYVGQFKDQITAVIACLNSSVEMMTFFSAAQMYYDVIVESVVPTLLQIEKHLEEGQVKPAQDLVESWAFPTLPRRTKDISAEEVEPVQNMIKSAREQYNKIRDIYCLHEEVFREQCQFILPYHRQLFSIYQCCLDKYKLMKQKRKALDFNDLERYCLQLLSIDSDSADNVSRVLHERYKYILVDEYQDISPIQEAIISKISHANDSMDSSKSSSLFMVGDVKQSIYGFRQADPSIFMDKYDSFRDENNCDCRSIHLSKNFRSNPAVIDGINAIFSKCMTPSFSGLDYARDAQLVYGGQEMVLPDSPAIELHYLDTKLSSMDLFSDTQEIENGVASIDVQRREAMVVANRIRAMIDEHFMISDPESGQQRALEYRDIAILLRSMKGQAEIWNEIFTKMKIPIYAEISGGFLDAVEIQDIISLLKCIDNPQQDIALVSCLRGPVVDLDDTQLALIRCQSPDMSIYEAVLNYATQGDDSELKNKLICFLNQLSGWRYQLRHESLSILIWSIYRQTNLLAYVKGCELGSQRYQNLLHFHRLSTQYDHFSRQGLSRFLTYLEHMNDIDLDLKPPSALTQSDNVVRMMSIHMSKGLEFPVVILGNLSKKFNTTDLHEPILFDRQSQGVLGMKIVHPVTLEKWPGAIHHILAMDKKRDLLAEELRLLYVAMTRSREHLILSASLDVNKYCQKISPWQFNDNQPLADFVLQHVQSPIDWIGSALASHPDFTSFVNSADKTEGRLFRVNVYDEESLTKHLNEMNDENDDETIDVEKWLRPDNSVTLTNQQKKTINQIQWQYPHNLLSQLSARSSVTELKRQSVALEIEEPFPMHSLVENRFQAEEKPAFMKDNSKPKASDVGSWVHAFLQNIDLTELLNDVSLEKQLSHMVQCGLFNENQATHIDLKKIETLFSSSLGQEILHHQATLNREWQFTLAIPAHKVYSKQVKETVQEKVLVRGVIDCLYETQEGMVIVDYKTDNIKKDQCSNRAKEYETQLNFYAQAVELILGKTTISKKIYFLVPGVTCEIDLSG